MNKYLLASHLVCMATGALSTIVSAVPIKNQTTLLPNDVKAYLPQGATSFYAERLPIGPNATKMFVHIWAAIRPNTLDSMNAYNRFSDSPFCVDIFVPVLDEKQRWGWHLASSAVYMDANSPLAVKTYWLNPSKKQGPVLQIVSSNGAPGVSTMHRLLVWDKGFQTGDSAPEPQLFSSGGSGGGIIAVKLDGVDERGLMKITVENSFADKIQSIETYHWNGKRFELSGPKK